MRGHRSILRLAAWDLAEADSLLVCLPSLSLLRHVLQLRLSKRECVRHINAVILAGA